MDIFTAAFAGVSVGAAAQDVFEILAGSSKRVILRKIFLGQYTDFGDAQAEILGVQIIRGYTTAGSGGTAITPVNIGPATRNPYPSAEASIVRNNTTIAQDGSASVLFADTFNIQAGWWYDPFAEERLFIDRGERGVVRITAPADAITMNATLFFEEK